MSFGTWEPAETVSRAIVRLGLSSSGLRGNQGNV